MVPRIQGLFMPTVVEPSGTWKSRKGLCGKPGPSQGGARTLLTIPTLVLSPGQNGGFQDSSTKPHPILTQKHFS